MIFIFLVPLILSRRAVPENPPPGSATESQAPISRPVAGSQPEEGVWLDNPGGSWWYEARGLFIEGAIVSAFNTNRDLKGCAFPATYDELLSYGLLPIIFHNRYTGEPIKSTREYSPGDIYYELNTQTGLYRFWRHQGPLDMCYNPDATGGKELPYAASPRDTVTDGKTIKVEMALGPEAVAGDVPAAYFRESYNIPPDDDARVDIYIVYRWVNDIMYRLGEFVDQVPASLDGYIEMLGERNPVAWTNPYTGEPMKAVGWYDVPLFFLWDPVSEVIPDIDSSAGPPPEGVAGNYSYMVAPSPVVEGEMRSYAKFYFKQPDGSIAAYLAIGVGPKEHQKGAISLDQ